ncbi:MAG TPA: hypothetical protein VE992_01465 [Solirubrobacteraceae bacterium]|nr:hypothetical protein [Solirubrobacteraceae bacterium]
MDAVWSRRLRWRRRGAWCWPAFAATTVADAAIGRLLPPSGDSEALVAAGLAGLVLNVLAVLLLTRPLAAVLRRRRPDLPTVVARDYAGTTVVLCVAGALLLAGLVHHQHVVADRNAMNDAAMRAESYIGARAPAEFRGHIAVMSIFAIEPGHLYRACVPGSRDARTYCVIVDTRRPFPGGVTFSGYEPNSLFSEGVN